MDEVEYHVEPVTGGMADLVSEVWHLRHGGDESPQMIAPDGCCEIILHRGTPPLERAGDGWERQSDAFLYGPLNRVSMAPSIGHSRYDYQDRWMCWESVSTRGRSAGWGATLPSGATGPSRLTPSSARDRQKDCWHWRAIGLG